ncbi:hypothetical protein AB751O23_AK_00010, partial [Chlamydiales bacterium SCGC AB-751-O23]
MLGDPFQLPPVEKGACFADFANFNKETIFTHSHLDICFRAEAKNLIELAATIKQRTNQEVLSFLSKKSSNIFYDPLKDESPQNIKEKCLDFYLEQLPKNLPDKEQDYLELFNQIKILIPLRRGAAGLEEVNSYVNHHLKKYIKTKNSYIFPIILKNNSRDFNLFNGEIGVFIYLNPSNSYTTVHNYALFQKEASEVVKVPQSLLPDFELAYCLSVHKSQGSEFKKVMIALPPGSELFGKEVFYTAVTRAKRDLHLLSNETRLK